MTRIRSLIGAPSIMLLAGAVLAVAAGCGTGGVAQGGTGGLTGAGGYGNGKSALSGLPTPPGDGGIARPAGTPGNVKILDWAGFKAAVSYTFDDTNSSQIQRYAELQALGVPMTFYLITGKTEFRDPVWMQALTDGHEIGNHTMSH